MGCAIMPEKDETDRVESFFQIQLIGKFCTSSIIEDPKQNLQNYFQECGITLNRSDFIIIDQSRFGNNTITIARYVLEYVHNGDPAKKKVCIEGSVTMETDGHGNRHIVISSKTDPFSVNFLTPHSEPSRICGN